MAQDAILALQAPTPRAVNTIPGLDARLDTGRAERLAAMRERLRDEIAEHGALPFDRYMELALYAPGIGYYSGGAPKFGAGGDFVTAPELTPLFGGCVARYCATALRPGDELIEFGAGSGRLAVDLLRALDELGVTEIRYTIIELSAELRARQRDTLRREAQDLLPRVSWRDAPPRHHDGVIVANEVLDAMPVSRFRITRDGAREQFVALEGDRLTAQWRPMTTPGLEEFIATHVPLAELPPGYSSEVCPRAAAWIETLARIPGRRLLLLIDYGYPRGEYYLAERDQGTLRCHLGHRAHDDPLAYPGIQDITAHVDFSMIATRARNAGLQLAGYTNQANFLLANGLDTQLGMLDPRDTNNWLDTAQAVKTLTLPSGMGERFGVMALTRGIDGEELTPLGLRDLRKRL